MTHVVAVTMDELMGTVQTLKHQINRLVTSFQEQVFQAQSNKWGRGIGRNFTSRVSRGWAHEKYEQRNTRGESLGWAGNQEGARKSQNNSRGGNKN